MKRRLLTLVLAALVLSVPGWAQDGLRGVLSSESYRPRLWPTVAGADLDGDNRPDAAVLVDAGLPPGFTRVIELHLTARSNSRLVFRSLDPSLAIAALDVNHDGSPDIVVERVFTRERVQVWLNDGRGEFRLVDARRFPAATRPTTAQADGGTARNGPRVALVLSGRTRLALATRRARQDHLQSSIHRPTALGILPYLRAIAPNRSRAPPSSL